MNYKPKDLQAFEGKMKEINATKETDPDILRRMIKIERDQATEIQAKLVEENERLRLVAEHNEKVIAGLNEQLTAEIKATGNFAKQVVEQAQEIRRKTIEECAKELERFPGLALEAAAIRALAQTDENKPEIEK